MKPPNGHTAPSPAVSPQLEPGPKAHGPSSIRGRRFDLVVFDLDGTLIDSSADLCAAVNATLSAFDHPPLPQAQITAFIGNGAAALIERAFTASTLGQNAHRAHKRSVLPALDQTLPFFLEYYRHHKLDRTRPYPGVLESLTEIRRREPHLPMAVLTNKPVRPSREICSALGLSPFFFATYGGDSQPKKPDPSGLERLMAEAPDAHQPVAADRVILVGDSHVDVETARRGGTLCLGCAYGLAPESLQAAQPDYLVTHPAEWVSILTP